MAFDTFGQSGTVRWAINSNAGFLLLLSQSDRNKIIRTSLNETGDLWRKAFLPQRFTDYVKRAPFNYRGKGKAFILHKARGLGLMKRWIDSDWGGWDPWEAGQPPLAVILAFKRTHPDAAKADIIGPLIRAEAKQDLTVKALAAAPQFIPMVMSGNLRASALTRSRSEARATSTKAVLKIRIPFPATGSSPSGKPSFGYNQNVARIMKTLPTWEVQWMAEKLKGSILKSVTSKTGTGSQVRGVDNNYASRPTIYAAPRVA